MKQRVSWADDLGAALEFIQSIDSQAVKVEGGPRVWEHTSSTGGRFAVIAVNPSGVQYGVGVVTGILVRFDRYRSVRATTRTRRCTASYRATCAIDDGGFGVLFLGDTFRVYGAEPEQIEGSK